MLERRLAYLREGYLKLTLNDKEIAEYREMIAGSEYLEDNEIRRFMNNPDMTAPADDFTDKEPQEAVFEGIVRDLNQPVEVKLRVIRSWMKMVAAAMIVVLAGSVIYILNSRSNKTVATYEKTDFRIAPGTQKATLTLADGKVVELDNGKSGELARQGASTINLSNGELAYATQNGSNFTGESLMKNTLSTPRGGEYKLLLPDGSKVWLNAASSLRYAPQFSRTKGAPREVELTGEAYFEIAQDASHPFIVKTPSTKVEVLGTSFNVNAYPDEARSRTTLVQGSVRVQSFSTISQSNKSIILKRGEQAELTAAGNITSREVDASVAIAWQQGVFSFENADVTEIMRQISRWYNVDINYEGLTNKSSSATYVIRFNRSLGIVKVLELLNRMNIHTRINGREVTVLL